MLPRQQLHDGRGRSRSSASAGRSRGRAAPAPAPGSPPATISDETVSPARSRPVAGGPQGHRAAEPAAEPADRVALGPGRRTGGSEWIVTVAAYGGAGRRAPTRCPTGAGGQRRRCRRGRRSGRGSTAPRRAGPRPRPRSSRPAGMPGPSSRTVTTTRSPRSSSSTQAGASGADVARARCRGRPARRRPARWPRAPGSSTGLPGRGDASTRVRGCRARLSAAARSTRRPRRRRPSASCCRISDRSARSCSPASRPSSAAVAAELGAAALHQREHLEHAVVDGPGQPGPLRRGRGRALGARRARRPSAAATRTGSRRSGRRSAAGRRCRSWPGRRSVAHRRGRPRDEHDRRRPGRRASRQWIAQASSAPITQKPGDGGVEARVALDAAA